MIEKLLEQSAQKNGYQISFILNHRVLTKAGRDWTEVQGEPLTIEDWEDLKDLCLQGNEKVQLETKGYITGVHQTEKHKWKFAFTEKKDCYRAHFSLIRNLSESQSFIENPLFWEAVKKRQGLFIFAGERRQGKTSLIQEVVISEQSSHLNLVGVHALHLSEEFGQTDSVVQLGLESLDYDVNHPVYEGLEKIVVDVNSVRNWKKWIELAEQGQCVYVSLSVNNLKTIFNKMLSDLDMPTHQRFLNILNGVAVQTLVGPTYYPCHEIFIVKEQQRILLKQSLEQQAYAKLNWSADFKDSYQSLNQSLIQRLIRRKIDVQAAFEASDDPEGLDVMLKKMGL